MLLYIPFADHAMGQIIATPIHELTDSMRLHPKPALILISTTWCTYCQMQKAQLRKNKAFQSASRQFYFTEFDAEFKEDIPFNGTTYRFKSTGIATGTHDLAFVLGNLANKLTLPTWVLIDENFEIRLKYPGLLNPEDLNSLLDAITISQAQSNNLTRNDKK
ncbi:thioredoxin family protein [Parapedobacter koreensis]|uniref:thioredoxin family protein n=1 Tax=Parapedobacter koreensis TaxID=332977 RepID=UPI0015A6393A|nr:thioredoxin family protein [Parapedobacter koreensis]